MIAPVGVVLEGSEKLASKLALFDDKVRNRILTRALRSAGRPIVAAIRSKLAPHSRSGALVKAQGLVIRKYRGSRIQVLVIGARKEFGAAGKRFAAQKIRPFKYFHLVDAPTKAQPPYQQIRRGGRPVVVRRTRGPTRGVGAVAAARAIASRQSQEIIASEIAAGIDAELVREVGG